MAAGKVKWFDEKKGYGFIVDDETNEDVFVHYSSIEKDGYRTLNEAARVEYKRSNGPNGMFAEHVIEVRP